MHHKQSRKGTKEGQRDGTHPKRGSRSAPPAPSGHHHRPKERATTEAPAILKIQIYLKFCRLLSPKIPRKHQSTPKIHLHLPLFAENLPRWTAKLTTGEDEGRQDGSPFAICRKGIKEGHPPPSCGATRAFHPHNFSHHKNRKKFAYLWLEKFSEIFYGRMFRVKESPQSCGKGARC